MYAKARLFGDTEIAEQILATDRKGECRRAHRIDRDHDPQEHAMTTGQFFACYVPTFQLHSGPTVYVPRDSIIRQSMPEHVAVAGEDRFSGAFRIVQNVSLEKLQAWLDGTLIQNAFPDMPTDDRAFITAGGVLELDA
jgi:hypothetical protein